MTLVTEQDAAGASLWIVGVRTLTQSVIPSGAEGQEESARVRVTNEQSSRAEEKVSEANFRAFEAPLISEPVAKAGVKFSESTDFSSQGSFDSAQDDTIFVDLVHGLSLV
jgi:hypothetical protein